MFIKKSLFRKKRFSFLHDSLSELCNFAGPDFESEDEEDDWESVSRRSASVSSDMSVFSCVSTLATEELDRLLEDVRTVEDDSIKVQQQAAISIYFLLYTNLIVILNGNKKVWSFFVCNCSCYGFWEDWVHFGTNVQPDKL